MVVRDRVEVGFQIRIGHPPCVDGIVSRPLGPKAVGARKKVRLDPNLGSHILAIVHRLPARWTPRQNPHPPPDLGLGPRQPHQGHQGHGHYDTRMKRAKTLERHLAKAAGTRLEANSQAMTLHLSPDNPMLTQSECQNSEYELNKFSIVHQRIIDADRIFFRSDRSISYDKIMRILSVIDLYHRNFAFLPVLAFLGPL